MPTHPGHPAIASTTLVSASRSLLNDAFDSVSLQTVTATATLNPDDGRYVLVAPASHATITLPDPASDERYQNVRLVLKRTTAGVYTATVVVAGGGLIDGSSSTTLNAQYDCEVLFSDGTAWHRLRDQTNLLAPDYLDFGDWIVGTDDSNPAPVATSDAYTAPDGTTTADELEWDNTTELADESWAEPGASVLEAGDGAEYSFYIDSEVGDGIKTVLEVEDTSVPGLLEQTTVAFSNVFAENHLIGTYGFESFVGTAPTATAASAPDGTSTAYTYECDGLSLANGRHTFYALRGEATISHYFLAESDVRRLRIYLSNVGASNTVYVDFNISVAAGIQVVSFSGSSSGLAYTASNALRYTQIPGTDWWRIDVRIAEYDGSYPVLTSDVWFYDSLNTQTSFTYWKADLRYGDHVSSQQLLTVDDGVENLAIDAGYGEFSDLTLSAGASIATSSIAAPDGTLTAVDVTSASAITLSQDILDTDFGAAWNDAATWTASWYVYTPSLSTSSNFVVALLNGATVQESATVTIDSDGDITSFTGVTQGAPSLSAERTIYAQSIGNTGWIKYEITLHDNGAASDRVRFIPISASSASNTYTLWSPALRYGDWVARGKNWLTNGNEGPALEDWDRIGSTLERSTVAALDGTLSAWDLTSGSASAFLRQENISGLPDGGRFQFTLYFYGIDSASASTLRLQVWQRNSGGSLSEYMRGYVNVDPDLLTLSVDNVITSGPGYTTDFLSVEAVGNNWFKWTVTWQDYGNDYNYAQFELSYYGSDPVTIWNPRLTVGNPADARGYFVSGPQNLLGDGSDLSIFGQNNTTLTTNVAVAPNGRLEADQESFAGTGNDFFVIGPAGSITPLQDRIIQVSAYFKLDATAPGGTPLRLDWRLYDPSVVVERVQIYLNMNAAAVTAFSSTTTGGPGYTTADVDIDEISNGWFRLAMNFRDYSGSVTQYVLKNQNSLGSAWSLTAWGFEVTTLDRTPTANELRPVSNGVVDFDAYPPEHRSLFADLEDAGDNWYKVTTKITDI